MPSMRERDIEKKVTEYAKKQGWLSCKWVSPAQRFVPDRLYFKDGKVIMIEFKAPGRKPTKAQRVMHKMLDNVGFKVYIVDDINAGQTYFMGD
jgi:hypothetical protein|tara:strand:+ start:492 stop:770 length:279 start_codon:yes stop_codon:yes gene_type:complete